MVESLGWGSPHWREAVKQGNRVSLKYATVDDDLLVAGDLIMCKYVMTTEGHANVGVLVLSLNAIHLYLRGLISNSIEI